MSDYLQTKANVKITDFMHFPVVNVKYKWQKRSCIFEESACIVMAVISTYLGHANQCVLLDNSFYRRACAAQIAGCLLMADMNKIRPDLLDAVDIFIKSKRTIWPDVYERREAARMVKGNAPEDVESDEEPILAKPLNTEIPILRFKVKTK